MREEDEAPRFSTRNVVVYNNRGPEDKRTTSWGGQGREYHVRKRKKNKDGGEKTHQEKKGSL